MRSHRLKDATSRVAAMAVAATDAVTSAVLAKRKAVTTLGSLKPTWHCQNPQPRKAMHRSLSKARAQMRRQRHKVKVVSRVHVTAMVVTAAIALTVQSTLRRTPSAKSHKWLLHLWQRQHQLQSVWLRSLLHPWRQWQWLSLHRLQWLPPQRRLLLRARRACPRCLATRCRPTTCKRLRNPLACSG